MSQTAIGAAWFRSAGKFALTCPRTADLSGSVRPEVANDRPPTSAGQENVLDIRVWTKPGAEQLVIRFPKSSGHFPAHVHLDQRELLNVALVDLIEISC